MKYELQVRPLTQKHSVTHVNIAITEEENIFTVRYPTHKTVSNLLQIPGPKCLTDGHNKPVYCSVLVTSSSPSALAMINAAPSLADVDCEANSRSREQRPAHPATHTALVTVSTEGEQNLYV